MGVFTFVCRESGGDWSAKQLNGDVEASANGKFDLQRKLVQAALSADSDSSGAVQSSFSYVTPTSAVFQVIVGGNVGGGGAASAAAAFGGGASTEAPPAEEKKEEIDEESDDEPFSSIFD